MRTKITTTIDEELLAKAKDVVKNQGLDGANAIIEKALRLYFSNSVEVWEKTLESGWIKKVVISEDGIHFENIKCRKSFSNYKPEDYTEEALQARGLQKVSEKSA